MEGLLACDLQARTNPPKKLVNTLKKKIYIYKERKCELSYLTGLLPWAQHVALISLIEAHVPQQ